MSENTAGAGQRGLVTVFLLDDHEVVRQSLSDLLEAEPDIQVIGEAGTAAEALARIPAMCPDVAILDMRLPDGDGVAVCRQLRACAPEVACLMLTAFIDEQAHRDAIAAGCAGYMLKTVRGASLPTAVRKAACARPGRLGHVSAVHRLGPPRERGAH
jgi:two-component system response regulator DevR